MPGEGAIAMKHLARTVVIVGVIVATCGAMLLMTPAQATFRGRNGRIAFALDRGSGAEIFTMKSDGSGRRQLTHQDRSGWFPFWSPDGTKIVFELDLPGEDCGSIELMNADGSGLVDLTSVAPRLNDACAQGPSFTPDGHRIVFDAGSNTLPEAIRSFNLKGKDVQRIIGVRRVARFAPHDRTLKSPRVSPDGRTLCFEVEHALGDTNEKGLFAMKMNGKDLQQIVPFSYDVSIKGGEWSPGGNEIMFSSNAGYSGQTVFTEPQNIFTVRPDGTGVRQLTDYHRLPPDLTTTAGSYSPDGRWIMFKHASAGRFTLLKMHADGSHLTRITRSKVAYTGATVWGPRPS
jgi:Tol biopolymer transport system component